MKRSLIAVAAILTFAIPAVCSATVARPGAYVSGFLGVTGVMDTDVRNPGGTIDDDVEFDPGVNVGGTGGFDFGFVRLEGELSYKHGEISAVNDRVSGINYIATDGSLGAMAAMFNVFFDLHNYSPVTPYLGGGVGFATLFLDDTFGTPSIGGSQTLLYVRDEDTVFAYQAGAGLEIELNPIFSIDLGYRYFATSEARFNDNAGAELKFRSHNGAVGFRVKF